MAIFNSKLFVYQSSNLDPRHIILLPYGANGLAALANDAGNEVAIHGKLAGMFETSQPRGNSMV